MKKRGSEREVAHFSMRMRGVSRDAVLGHIRACSTTEALFSRGNLSAVLGSFFLLLPDFDDFCGCFVIVSASGKVVSSACEFEEECFIGDILE